MARFKAPWTDEEVCKLKDLAGTIPIALLAQELNRTIGSVMAKAAEEKLSVLRHSTTAPRFCRH
jgi:hypothetical protein